MSTNNWASIEVEVVAISDGAVLVSDGDEEVWVPFSLISRDSDIGAESERGESGTLIIPEWKAYELELI